MYRTSESPSAVLPETFSLIALLVVSVVVLLILRYYLPLRTTPAFLLVPVFFALWLPASIILLVPIDLASSARTDDSSSRGIWLPDRLILISWRITYWLTFVLTWFILPVLAEYSDAGYREPLGRLKYSLLSNARYNAVVLGSGIVGLIYVSISYGVTLESLMGVLMALAYCWGLALAVYLMGHGLVAIPRSLFRNASISGRLRRIQAKAPKVHEKMEDAIQKLEDLEAHIALLSKRKTGSAKDFQDWIEELAEAASLPETRPATLSRRMSSPSVTVPTVITERYLADISRQFYRARHSRIRFTEEWDRLVQEASATQGILDSVASKRLEDYESSRSSFLDRLFTPYTRYLYCVYLIPCARILLGGFLSLASICIIWSELIKVASPSLSLSIINLTVVHHPNSERGQIGFPGQVIASTWIMYMCSAALSSMTEVRVWRGRALVRRNTAYESALWYAMQVAKLSVPLAYNFLTFLSHDVYKNTTFFQFLGNFINLTPLGKWFDRLFPAFILVPVCATLFNLYGRVKRLMGFGIIEDEDEEENRSGYGTGGWREGRDLIERELNGGSSLAHLRNAPPAGHPRTWGAPGRGTTPRQVTGNSTPSNSATSATLSTRQNSKPKPAPTSPSDPDPESDGFFAMLSHRVKNTLDTVQTPNWMKEGIKRPKWMDSIQEPSSSSTAPEGSGSNIVKLFGGSGSGGRIRL